MEKILVALEAGTSYTSFQWFFFLSRSKSKYILTLFEDWVSLGTGESFFLFLTIEFGVSIALWIVVLIKFFGGVSLDLGGSSFDTN